MDYERRLTGLQEQMKRQGLALAVYGPSPDFQYLTGLALDWRGGPDANACQAAALVSPDAPPTLLLPEGCEDCAERTWVQDLHFFKKGSDIASVIRQALSDQQGPPGAIALGKSLTEGIATGLKAVAGEAEHREAEGLMDGLRMIKDPEEIERLRRVAALTDKAFEAAIPRIEEGITQPELAAEIALQGKRLGASDVSFPPAAIFTKSGSEPSQNPFIYPRDKGLEPGVALAFDFGFVLDGYSSDFGRSLYFGEAPQDVIGAYEALRQSVVETVGKMRPGAMALRDLFPEVEKTLDRLGYGDYLRARLPDRVLGHQIGIDVHENPWIKPHCDQLLSANMTMAIEPKLWRSGEYYLRVEDIVCVGEDGAEFLTNFDRTRFQL